jgi:hypothetical protein
MIMGHSPAPMLVITGMHRSGTSVITAAFASAGLDVGSRLMPGARGNPRGHFEDLDFVTLHERMLRANGLGPEGFTTVSDIPVPTALEDEALALVADRRRRDTAWGWKDPRTTLFLDWWADQLPDARFVFLVRSPAEVVDSLFRRRDEAFALNPGFAIDVWMAYNRRILEFVRLHPDRCLLACSETAVADPERLVSTVRSRWCLPLAEPAGVVEPTLFRRQAGAGRRGIVARMSPEALQLHASLQLAAGADPAAEGRQAAEGSPDSLALAEWCRGARLEGLLAEAEAQREAVAAELAVVRAEIAAATGRCESLAGELRKSERLESYGPKKPVHVRLAREVRRLIRRWLRSGTAAEDEAATPQPSSGSAAPFSCTALARH